MKNNKDVKPVIKPTLEGSWHGRDAVRMIPKRFLAVLIIALLYLIAGLMITFESLILRALLAVLVVIAGVYFMYNSGINKGENDAAHGEIMYQREQDGRGVSDIDRDRCFHPLKGYFAAFMGALPFLIFTIVFACITTTSEYTLSLLPSWTEGFMRQADFSEALAYYNLGRGMQAIDFLRILDRALVMPFISVTTLISENASLLVERLSPILMLIAPMAYGAGYAQGKNIRIQINTGIREGDNKKKRRERKARKQRQQRSKQPEQLI